MDKANNAFPISLIEDRGSGPAFGESISDPDWNINQRVAQLLMLLQQLDECSGGLGTLPAPELSEVVSSALGLCGFVDPIEARDVIATILEAVESPDSTAEVLRFGSAPVRRN
jgi:hypothetical protein